MPHSALIGDRGGDRVGIAPWGDILPCRDLSVNGERLGKAGAGARKGIGSDGVAPIRGIGGILIKKVVEGGAPGTGHLPGRSGGAGRGAGIQAHIVRGGVGAGYGDGRIRVVDRSGIGAE